MLFAIDEYNYFQDYTGYNIGHLKDILSEKPYINIHAKQITFVRGLDRILAQNSVNKFNKNRKTKFLCVQIHTTDAKI
jgi:hypothetical protein